MIDISHFNHPKLTIGQVLAPAMEIELQEDANSYFEAYVAWLMKNHVMLRGPAERVARDNLGYMAGYYDVDVRRRVQKLFHAYHPVFGSKEPTPEEAFNVGQRWAEGAEATRDK